MNAYLLIEVTFEDGATEHEFVKVNHRTDDEKRELIQAFLDDLVEEGHEHLLGVNLAELDFDLLEVSDTITLSGMVHVSAVYGVGQN